MYKMGEKVKLNNRWIHSCTTEGCVVVQLKGVVTRLGRAAEPSDNIWEAMCFDLKDYMQEL